MPRTRTISIDLINLEGCQSRAATNNETVHDYAEKWEEGVAFPPVDLFHDGAEYFPGDGIHRILGAIEAGLDEVPAVVHKGGQRAARLFAAAANQTHGLKRTNADKRKAVQIVLELEPKWSNRKIADHCGVSDMLVGDVRDQVQDSCTSNERIGADGKTYKLKHRPEEPEDDLPAELAGEPAAERQKPPKSGTPVRKPAELKADATDYLRRAQKAIRDLGIYQDCRPALSDLYARVKKA